MSAPAGSGAERLRPHRRPILVRADSERGLAWCEAGARNGRPEEERRRPVRIYEPRPTPPGGAGSTSFDRALPETLPDRLRTRVLYRGEADRAAWSDAATERHQELAASRPQMPQQMPDRGPDRDRGGGFER